MLGKLTQVELRESWKHEAHDFTNWLALQENIELLSEAIGLELEVLETEASVGRFNVDVLAEEINSERKVIIENQLEFTDHDHLGKIITYASGLDAQTIIWIVKEVREEHRQAIDWLNDQTNEETLFFLLKIELWQIGDSLPAPKFVMISKPNDWAKTVKQQSKQQLSDRKLNNLAYWQQFAEFLSNNKILNIQKPRPQHWAIATIGSSAAHLSFTIVTREDKYGVELYIPNDKDLFHTLYEEKSDIEEELGFSLEWMELPGRKASRVKVMTGADFKNEETWENGMKWMVEIGEKFYRAFSKRVSNLSG